MINIEHKPPKVRVGYLGTEVTKPPDWHGLVTLDLLLNNLTTGLFLTAAAGELARPGLIGPVARLSYPIALVLLLVDLGCLVLDLGSPTRFHHMLRVFKPTSPMSLGTWSLTAYSAPLSLVVALDLAGGPATPGAVAIRKLILALGLVPAFGAAIYKGVLFSTSSQPGWKDARWLGAYLVNSALMYGAAVLHALAPSLGPTRWATVVLVATNLILLGRLGAELSPALARVHGRAGVWRLGAWSAGVGLLAPLALLMLSGGALAAWAALAGLIVGGLAWRHAVVMLPHEVQRAAANSPA